MEQDYGLLCVWGVLPLLLASSYVTRYWQPENNFYETYIFDRFTVANFMLWLQSYRNMPEESASLGAENLPTEHIPVEAHPENKAEQLQQTINEASTALGDAFIDYLHKSNFPRAFSEPSDFVEEFTQHGIAAEDNELIRFDELPDNVIPLYKDFEIGYLRNAKPAPASIERFTGEIFIDGESHQLDEASTKMVKDSFLLAMNQPSTTRERMYRDFIISFHKISYDKGIADLTVQLTNLHYDAKRLLVIETSYGPQYYWQDGQFKEQTTTPESAD